MVRVFTRLPVHTWCFFFSKKPSSRFMRVTAQYATAALLALEMAKSEWSVVNK